MSAQGRSALPHLWLVVCLAVVLGCLSAVAVTADGENHYWQPSSMRLCLWDQHLANCFNAHWQQLSTEVTVPEVV